MRKRLVRVHVVLSYILLFADTSHSRTWKSSSIELLSVNLAKANLSFLWAWSNIPKASLVHFEKDL